MPPISLLSLPGVFAYAGVALFAATGAMAAAARKHDVVTFVFFAAITGLGGGTLRDLLLGQPIGWTRDPAHLIVASAVGVLVWLVGFRERARRLLLWPDALGLSAFAVVGAGGAFSLPEPTLGVVSRSSFASGVALCLVPRLPTRSVSHE